MPARSGTIQTPVIIAVLVILGIGLFVLSQGKLAPVPPPPEKPSPGEMPNLPSPAIQNPPVTSSSAKGVIMVQSPTKGQEIKPPLTVSGLVYGNMGTLTIKLKQKESGMYVTEDKVVKISGKSDNISFAEAIMFGLPAMPQEGILEIIYKDASGQGLDDKVEIVVNFPSDLGRGE